MKKSNFSKTVKIGLFGLGTVGMGVYKTIQSQARAIQDKTGIHLSIQKICVQSVTKKRLHPVPSDLLTTDPSVILKDPSIEIVVELMGGIHPAKEIILSALKNGKHVVTANKALLAEEGNILFETARLENRQLGFEASVCGGIPIVNALKEGLAANEISKVLGIVNGTCNYILTAMSSEGTNSADALKKAQHQGFAEKNPKFDIEGIDSAHKLAILARLAFGATVDFKSIQTQGIKDLSPIDIQYAKELGYAIKLLAVGRRFKDGFLLRVRPTLLALDHPLSSVNGVFNAVFVEASLTGDLLFYGRGAGMFPTASAVMSDVLSIAKNIQAKQNAATSIRLSDHLKLLPQGTSRSRYYLRFEVIDRPGVLGGIAQTLGKHNISILSVHQKESHGAKSVPVVILTTRAQEKDLLKALKVIDARKEITQKTVVMPVES